MRIERHAIYISKGGRYVGPAEPHPSNKDWWWLADDMGVSRVYLTNGHCVDNPDSWSIKRVATIEESHDHRAIQVAAAEAAKFGRGAFKVEHVSFDQRPTPPDPDFAEVPEAPALYAPLFQVLCDALAQAERGKGHERHANGKAIDRQPIMEIGRMAGVGFNVGQAMKKSQEAVGMIERGNPGAAVRELLGAINYTASAIMLVREKFDLNGDE